MKTKFSILFLLILITLGFAIPHRSAGQLWTTNGAFVTVNTGAQVTVKGDIQNNAGSTIDNGGTIDFSGNWTHNASNNCFGTSAGVVTLNGSDQVIGGTNSTTFNILQLQGTGTVTLQSDISVGGGYAVPAGVLDLGSQNLDLNSFELTLTNQSPLCIFRMTGFIQSETPPVSGYGRLKWYVGNSPAGSAYEFPFGNISTASYLPLGFNVTTAGSGTGFVRASTYPTDPAANPNNRPLPTGMSVLINTAGVENAPNVIDRWWNITTEDFVTDPVANLVFSYRESEWSGGTNTINENLLQGQRFDGSVWSYPPMGTVNPAVNEVTVFNVNNFNSIWTLVGSNSPLPIELLYFTAVPVDNKKVRCAWATLTQINNDFFTVERSKDAMNFAEAGMVDGAGNSTQELFYSFDDENPFRGVSYYRLRQTDLDGRFSYSNVVSVNLTDYKNITGVVFPNPATEFVFLQINSSIDPASTVFEVSDAIGRIVSSDPLINLVAAENMFRYNRNNLAPGVYFFRIVSNDSLLMKGKIEFQ